MSQFLEWGGIEPFFRPRFSDRMPRRQSEKRQAFNKNLLKIIQNPVENLILWGTVVAPPGPAETGAYNVPQTHTWI